MYILCHLYEHGVMLCDTLLGEGFKVDRSFLRWTCLSQGGPNVSYGGLVFLKVVCYVLKWSVIVIDQITRG